MIKIRERTFETNSSSTHSIAICTEAEYKDWQQGKLLFNKDCFQVNEQFLSREQVIEQLKKSNYYKDLYEGALESNNVSEINNLINDFGFYSYLEYTHCYDGTSMEYFTRNYQTPGGENIVAFGVFGYDG